MELDMIFDAEYANTLSGHLLAVRRNKSPTVWFFHFARLRCRFGVHNFVASLCPGSMWATNIVNERERFADAVPWDHGAHHSHVYGLAGLVPECGVLM